MKVKKGSSSKSLKKKRQLDRIVRPAPKPAKPKLLVQTHLAQLNLPQEQKAGEPTKAKGPKKKLRCLTKTGGKKRYSFQKHSPLLNNSVSQSKLSAN